MSPARTGGMGGNPRRSLVGPGYMPKGGAHAARLSNAVVQAERDRAAAEVPASVAAAVAAEWPDRAGEPGGGSGRAPARPGSSPGSIDWWAARPALSLGAAAGLGTVAAFFSEFALR